MTPYSDAWRRETRERLAALGLTGGAIARRTGLDLIDLGRALTVDGLPLDFELVAVVEETLRKLGDKALARAIRRSEVAPVAVDLDPLTNCAVHFDGDPP